MEDQTVKIEVWASAWSNISYNLKRVIDTGIYQDEWEDMDLTDRDNELDELAHRTVLDDIDYGWNIIEDDEA